MSDFDTHLRLAELRPVACGCCGGSLSTERRARRRDMAGSLIVYCSSACAKAGAISINCGRQYTWEPVPRVGPRSRGRWKRGA